MISPFHSFLILLCNYKTLVLVIKTKASSFVLLNIVAQDTFHLIYIRCLCTTLIPVLKKISHILELFFWCLFLQSDCFAVIKLFIMLTFGQFCLFSYYDFDLSV